MKRRYSKFSARLLVHSVVVRPLLKLIFGVIVKGREHLSGLDQYIVIANHNSHLDILLIYSVLPPSHIVRTSVVAAEDYFAHPKILFWLVNFLFAPVWYDRESAAADPLKDMAEKVMEGGNIVLFPEGTRGRPGEISRFHTGVARLAQEFKHLPIVPVFLSGPERSFPKESPLPIPLWNSVNIGLPLLFTGDAQEFTQTLQGVIQRYAAAEAAARQKRPEKRRPSQLLAVMGIDGSGKSTLSRSLAKDLSRGAITCLVTDDLEVYEHGRIKPVQALIAESVRETIGHYAKQAKSLKYYKIPKLAELLLRDFLLGEIERWYRPDIIVQDGSPLLNLVGWSILYKESALDPQTCSKALKILGGEAKDIDASDPIFKDFPELLALKRYGLANMRLPTALIFLDVDPATCCERIRQRGQRIQPHETEEKLTRMRKGYLQVCTVVRDELKLPLHIVQSGLDIDQVHQSAMQFAQHSIAECAKQ